MRENAEAISGSMDCYTSTSTLLPQLPPPHSGPAKRRKNVNYLGNDIQVLSAISTFDCSLKCRSQEECRFFTYIRAKKQCLKNSDANRINASEFVLQ
ncbi:MAG: hypothetical protein KVP17_004403 [Porospora cf. gigantea B]|uniref:uncharacterized protein n=1 Tax=Porospora cf. gigantea B TaxID=2853592 RepID=UPI00357198BB|nr:MAG: hypothetical protein KVP17_004403 [Porospora cf. gigantea B]